MRFWTNMGPSGKQGDLGKSRGRKEKRRKRGDVKNAIHGSVDTRQGIVQTQYRHVQSITTTDIAQTQITCDIAISITTLNIIQTTINNIWQTFIIPCTICSSSIGEQIRQFGVPIMGTATAIGDTVNIFWNEKRFETKSKTQK